MGTTYPDRYPPYAIQVAEAFIQSAVETRLRKEGRRWKAPYFFLSSKELTTIRRAFWEQPSDRTLLSFVGLVFSKVCPQIHYEFVSDGFVLRFGGSEDRQTVVVHELPPCSRGENRPRARQAANDAVAALINWRLAGGVSSWSDFVEGSENYHLIYGTLYDMIKTVGGFNYCRTHNVIQFIYDAVPELHKEWNAAGLELVPVYHADPGFRRFTALMLTPKTPA